MDNFDIINMSINIFYKEMEKHLENVKRDKIRIENSSKEKVKSILFHEFEILRKHKKDENLSFDDFVETKRELINKISSNFHSNYDKFSEVLELMFSMHLNLTKLINNFMETYYNSNYDYDYEKYFSDYNNNNSNSNSNDNDNRPLEKLNFIENIQNSLTDIKLIYDKPSGNFFKEININLSEIKETANQDQIKLVFDDFNTEKYKAISTNCQKRLETFNFTGSLYNDPYSHCLFKDNFLTKDFPMLQNFNISFLSTLDLVDCSLKNFFVGVGNDYTNNYPTTKIEEDIKKVAKKIKLAYSSFKSSMLIETISYINNLKELSLIGCNITNKTFNNILRKITKNTNFLDFSHNIINGIDQDKNFQLDNVTTLILNGNKIRFFDGIASSFTNLKLLDLRNNLISTFHDKKDNKYIERNIILLLSNNDMINNVKFKTHYFNELCKIIRFADSSDDHNVKGFYLVNFFSHKSENQNFKIYNAFIENEVMELKIEYESSQYLNELIFSASIQFFLEELDLSYNFLTDEDIELFMKINPNFNSLKNLILKGNMLTGSFISSFKLDNMNNLKQIDISENKLSIRINIFIKDFYLEIKKSLIRKSKILDLRNIDNSDLNSYSDDRLDELLRDKSFKMKFEPISLNIYGNLMIMAEMMKSESVLEESFKKLDDSFIKILI